MVRATLLGVLAFIAASVLWLRHLLPPVAPGTHRAIGVGILIQGMLYQPLFWVFTLGVTAAVGVGIYVFSR